jgi:hypothetical protein
MLAAFDEIGSLIVDPSAAVLNQHVVMLIAECNVVVATWIS